MPRERTAIRSTSRRWDPFGNVGRQAITLGILDVTVPFLSTATATLAPATHFLGVGDIDGDGHLDAVELTEREIRLHVGAGDGTFTLASTTRIEAAELGYGGALAVGDFDEAGGADVVRSLSRTQFETWLSNGRSGFGRGSLSSSPGATRLKAGDYDGDGKLDLLGFSFFDFNVSLALGDGLGRFTQTWSSSLSPFASNSFGAGDVSGDGITDFAVAGASWVRIMGQTERRGAISVWVGSSTGRPQLVTLLDDWPRFADGMVVGDFNEDGRDDIIANGVDLVYLESLGGGAFATAVVMTSTASGDLRSVDVNADGHLDLVEFFGSPPSRVGVRHGRGNGTFSSVRTSTIPTWTYDLEFGDADEDSLLDLILLRASGVEFARGTGE